MSEQKRFLVIEDDHDSREIIALILRVQGFDVQVAENRDKALAIVADFDVIVMDYMMPGVSAFTYCQKIREQSPHTRIILTTAGNIAQTRADFLGIATFVGKPFTPGELSDAVNIALAKTERLEGEHVAAAAASAQVNTAPAHALPHSNS